MAAAVVAAVITKCRGEWRERVVDCADAREKRAKVCGIRVFVFACGVDYEFVPIKAVQNTGPGRWPGGAAPNTYA